MKDNEAMPQSTESEQVIWSGSPTQWLGAGWYALLIIMIVGLGWVHYRWQPWPMGYTLAGAALLLVPVLIVWAGLKTTHYQLSSERLRSYHGILLRHVDELELYRVRDSAVVEPILLRLLGCGHVVLMTSDLSTPQLWLRAVRKPHQVRELIRHRVEQVRAAKGVRSLDVE